MMADGERRGRRRRLDWCSHRPMRSRRFLMYRRLCWVVRSCVGRWGVLPTRQGDKMARQQDDRTTRRQDDETTLEILLSSDPWTTGGRSPCQGSTRLDFNPPADDISGSTWSTWSILIRTDCKTRCLFIDRGLSSRMLENCRCRQMGDAASCAMPPTRWCNAVEASTPDDKNREVLTPANQERLSEGQLRERETWNGVDATTIGREYPVCRRIAKADNQDCVRRKQEWEEAEIDRVAEETIKELSWRKRGRTNLNEENKWLTACCYVMDKCNKNKYNVLLLLCVIISGSSNTAESEPQRAWRSRRCTLTDTWTTRSPTDALHHKHCSHRELHHPWKENIKWNAT